MTMAEIDAEIAVYMRALHAAADRQDDEEFMMLIAMVM